MNLPFLSPPAHPGDPLSRVDTPSLVLDLPAFERNLALMQSRADAAKVALRPHAKAHKCPTISLAQIQRGAVGVCCQKVSEALPFIDAGVDNIHISNEIAGPQKAALLAQLAHHARMSVCVDHADQVAALTQAAAEAGSRLDVFVDLNIGQNRCGVDDAMAALCLVKAIEASPQLHFKGLQAYHGSVQHLRGHAERRDAAWRAAERTQGVIAALAQAGVVCEVVTGGGSGSVEFDLESGVYTEVQAGSYVFMDGDYGRNEYSEALRFEHSLFLACTVMSVGNGKRIVVDAGLKSLAVDSGLPTVWEQGRHSVGLNYATISDEHGVVEMINADVARPVLGSQLLLVPGHCDPTLNLHDELVAVRDGVVEAIWPIAARGLSR